MIEPRERDWGKLADWAKVPQFAPTVPAMLAHCRGHYAGRELLVLDEQRWTYGEIEARSAILARQLLAAGVGKGTRIGIMLPNDEAFITSWLAVTRIGAVAVTISTLSTAAELQRVARHADLHLLIAAERYLHHDFAQRIQAAFPGIDGQSMPYRLPLAPFLRAVWLWSGAPENSQPAAWARRIDLAQVPAQFPNVGADLLAAVEAEVASSDPAGIIYTSGSTSEPKGVIHSQGNFIRQAQKLAASYDHLPDERFYASMPFFWVGGITVTVLCIMQLGAAMLASTKSGPGLLDFLEQERTTSLIAWPHIMRGLAADPSFSRRDWSSMRSGLLYEALPAERRPADPTLMGMALGMTETNASYTVAMLNPESQRGAVGPLMPGAEARLVDPESGEVIAVWDGPHADSRGRFGVMQVRIDVLMLGMVKRERADVFEPDGWYATGDLCSFRDGYVHFHGRADDLIKASGANVSPREVEGVLLQLEGVASASVYGVTDAQRGAVVGAVVVPRQGAALQPDDIRRQAAKFLSAYKVPRVIVVMQAAQLPMMSSTKVDRRALIKILQEANDGATAV